MPKHVKGHTNSLERKLRLSRFETRFRDSQMDFVHRNFANGMKHGIFLQNVLPTLNV